MRSRRLFTCTLLGCCGAAAHAGGMTGALFGALIGKERWARVALPVEARPSLGTALGSDLRLSVSYSWEPGRR